MMNYTLRAGAAFISCLLLVQPLSAAEPVGKVLNAKTAVYSAGSAGKRTLGDDDPVFFMDRLSTNATGIGEFIFDDGTKLAIGPSASLVVDQFVQKDESTFKKFGVKSTKGAFRWISGSSPSAAYRVKTPMGTMGIRGTALDVVSIGGVTHVVLLNGKAQFCTGSRCEALSRTGDYISIKGGVISEKQKVTSAFKSRKEAAQTFKFLGNPKLLSPAFRVAGSNLLDNVSFGGQGGPGPKGAGGGQPGGGQPGGGGGGGEGGGPGGGGEGGKKCGGSCGKGNNGNGTGNEGKGPRR
jgi:hypothetical protein